MLRCQAKHWCILLPLWLLMGNLVSWCCHEFVGVIIWCLGGQMKILGFIRLQHKWFPHSSRTQFKVGLLLWSLDFGLLSCYIVTFVLSDEGPFRFFGHCLAFFFGITTICNFLRNCWTFLFFPLKSYYLVNHSLNSLLTDQNVKCLFLGPSKDILSV